MSVSDDQLRQLLGPVEQAAALGGQAILRVAEEEDLNVRGKEDGSPVTRADLAANRAIVDALATLEPRRKILTEEGEPELAVKEGWTDFWCVDPLDGTKEFIAGRDEYTVNIALVEDGVPVLGVIVLPAAGKTYLAARGCGVRLRLGRAAPVPVQPSAATEPVRAVVSRSHLQERTKRMLDAVGAKETVCRGSSAKFCAVAEGSAEVYLRTGPTNVWDTAAGAAIARAAGCAVTDLSGTDLDYSVADGLLREELLVCPHALLDRILQRLG